MLKRSYFKTKPHKPLKRTAFKKKAPKKTPRAKKMALKKEIIETYSLPNLLCQRYGTTKGATRQDILKGMLWNVFSSYIRYRDAGKCISCAKPKTYEELQAGHFAPAGGNNIELLFMEENVNGECEPCNAFDQFHLVRMRPNLINKWGEEKVVMIEKFEASKISTKWVEYKYVEKIKYYAKFNEAL